MLTTADLLKVRDVLRTAVDERLGEKLGSIKKELEKVKTGLDGVGVDVVNLRTDMLRLEKEQLDTKKELKSEIRKLRVGQKEIVSFFDRDIIDHRRRLDRVESYLHLPPLPEAVFQEVEV